MRLLRLVVTGAVGAGKSTFVRTVSQIDALDTDRIATDETALIKPKTTVGFDFGKISFLYGLEIQIYGTPGQVRFGFMRDLLINRADAYILLVAAHRPQDLVHARQILDEMNARVQIPMLIGVTYKDLPGAWTSSMILEGLGYGKNHNQPRMIAIDPDDRASVMQAVCTLLMTMQVR